MPARRQVRDYTDSIVRDEWPLLAEGRPSPRTEVELYGLFNAVGQIHPVDARDTAIFAEVFRNLNDLVGLRRDRLIHSESGMPMILRIVGLVGSMLIVAYTATFPRTRTNLLMVSGISIALGLVFLFILIVDRPFMGPYSVNNAESQGPVTKIRPARSFEPAGSGRHAVRSCSSASSTCDRDDVAGLEPAGVAQVDLAVDLGRVGLGAAGGAAGFGVDRVDQHVDASSRPWRRASRR